MNFTGNDVVLFFMLHLLGDYILQTDWMASNKTKSLLPATIHAFVYAVPFIYVFKPTMAAGMTIFVSHAIIDHWRLARYVIFAKNWLNDPSQRWSECNNTGYPNTMPAWMSVWLMIIADNTIHLFVNYGALRWL